MANTCRDDYNPQNGIHVIRMPSFLHESLLQKILFDITLQLEKLRNSPIKPVAEFVAGATSVGSANLTIDGGYFSLDVQFKRKEHHLPGLVIEIAFSQSKKRKGKDLARLAESYILGSNGNVKRIIGIEIVIRTAPDHSSKGG